VFSINEMMLVVKALGEFVRKSPPFLGNRAAQRIMLCAPMKHRVGKNLENVFGSSLGYLIPQWWGFALDESTTGLLQDD
jgi:hypothetical protein